jgi:hypothetical protein
VEQVVPQVVVEHLEFQVLLVRVVSQDLQAKVEQQVRVELVVLQAPAVSVVLLEPVERQQIQGLRERVERQV